MPRYTPCTGKGEIHVAGTAAERVLASNCICGARRTELGGACSLMAIAVIAAFSAVIVVQYQVCGRTDLVAVVITV